MIKVDFNCVLYLVTKLLLQIANIRIQIEAKLQTNNIYFFINFCIFIVDVETKGRGLYYGNTNTV